MADDLESATSTTTDTSNRNVAVAFGLVIGAGAATAIGAAVVFFPRLVRLASRRTLAAALGLSAGVMTYVSFVEIFRKSWVAFVDAGFDEDREAYVYATVCFFSGVVLMLLLNAAVSCLLGGHHHHHDHDSPRKAERTSSLSRTSHQSEADGAGECNNKQRHECEDDDPPAPAACMCCAEDPAADLEIYRQICEEIVRREKVEEEQEEEEVVDEEDPGDEQPIGDAPTAQESKEEIAEEATAVPEEGGVSGESPQWVQEEAGSPANVGYDDDDDDDVDAEEGGPEPELTEEERHENRKLMRMSINTAVAIAIHNFPEGLATFVAALADPAVGVVLAVAISIHNIPEGLCVAMPIYYATGNKWKAFMWGCLSGASEPVAALLGWAVLANSFSDTVYAIMFGLVAGMMVIISTKELLPTASRYDPEDTVVTYSYVVGMGIMALSLVLFVL